MGRATGSRPEWAYVSAHLGPLLHCLGHTTRQGLECFAPGAPAGVKRRLATVAVDSLSSAVKGFQLAVKNAKDPSAG
jgi:hypothetical protein